MVCKGVPAASFLRHPPLDPACPPPPHTHTHTHTHTQLRNTPTLMHPPSAPSSDQPIFLGLNKYQKGDFTRSTVTFYQKSIFNLLNPFITRLS